MVALYLLSGLFIAAVLGLGIFISTIAQTQMQATQLSMILPAAVRLPVGLHLPDRRHAGGFQALSQVIPARYFIEVVRGIVLRGAGLDELWVPVSRNWPSSPCQKRHPPPPPPPRHRRGRHQQR